MLKGNSSKEPAWMLPVVIIIALTLMTLEPLSAQETTSRPRLGLALSGGGAKGLAHLGVIKAMEEAGLKPDYITGVSMGSIVGGMYAMGYTPDSIASMFREYDWGPAMSDRISENKIIFLEKKHFHNSLIALPITRNAIHIPSGLISGQQIESGLNHYFWPAAGITDFSRLPIPFLCLATDVVTTKKVIFRNGYLPDAIRASISIPSIFSPVRTDTAVLVDGGVVRNYAVTELREMGADIVIGSYVSFKGYTEKDLESAYGILKQIGFLTSLADYEEQKRQTDIMIEPDLAGFNTMSFNEVDSLMAKGYREALKFKDKFRKLADSLDSFGPREPVLPLPDVKYYRFDSIRVTGNKLITEEQIIGVLDVAPGENADRELLEERIELLYGKNWFEKVKYRIIPTGNKMILEIDCIERPKAMLYGSAHYDPWLSAGAVVSISVRDLLTTGSVINLDSYIGQYYRFRLSAIQFVDKSQKFGVEASLFTDNTRLPLIALKTETGPMLSQNLVTSLSLSKRLSLNHLMTLSTSLENQHLIPDFVASSHITRLSYDYLRFMYTYQANTLNQKHFPDQGITYGVSLSSSKLLRGAVRISSRRFAYGPDDQDSPFSFNRTYMTRAWFNTFVSPSEKVTLSMGGDFLFSTGTDSITKGSDFWLLGGTEPLTDHSITAIGFHPNQVLVRNTGGVRFSTDIEIATDLHLILEGNIFALTEPDRKDGFTIMGGYGIGAGYMTVAGPLKIGIMHGFYDRQLLYRNIKGYISMGFSF
ncbi:MAG TPA: patatin-like phospholipase family protein [Bacteroidales bacterium]|nr:patatin-like phospholipase family protein [Bacteroidales bacterium]HPQ64622.1 patatin-like phospholipase family protein [Bacteroidales bacterium]